jgi:hypothetical protein
LFLFGVSLTALLSVDIKAGFGGFGLLLCGFNEADLPGFDWDTDRLR